MGSGKLIKAIRIAAEEGRLEEPFSAHDVKRAVPDFAPKTYHVFLPKHRLGNPGGYTELFKRIGPGLYRLL